MTDLATVDGAVLDGRRAQACPPALAPFAEVGILTSADVHVARTLCRLFADDNPLVALAVACAARAPRVGHSCLDVDRVADSVTDELPATDQAGDEVVAGLPWPDPDEWVAAVTASPLAAPGLDGAPLVVEGRQVFLARYRDHERRVATDLRARAAATAPLVDLDRLEGLLDVLFPGVDAEDPQRRAARTAATRRLAVVAGGPGTGKTWTVARILAVLVDQAQAAGTSLGIALVAPTGKAAARLDEGVRDAAATMPVDDGVREVLQGLDRGQTIHRLLGRRSNSRFWHDHQRPLPHDVVVVDETSMASLSLMARLLDAIRPDARVVLVGDPDQLASVEAGSVLADVVGDGRLPAGDDLAPGLVVLQRPHRFGADSGIGQLARAIRDGDADEVCGHLRDRDDVDWIPTSAPVADDLGVVRGLLSDRARDMVAAARAGDVGDALEHLGRAVVLCAHRRGRDGVAGWNHLVDTWLAADVDAWRPHDPWQPGRAVLATGNDRQLQVFNGDLGVVVTTDDGIRVAFHPPTASGQPDMPGPVPPVRLEQAEPVHAMTIHKSQGSQWDHVVVVLPGQGSRILTRELLYTAVTRAARRLTVIGDEAVIRHAVGRPIRRASGLRRRLSDRSA